MKVKASLLRRIYPLIVYFFVGLLCLVGLYVTARHLFKTDEQIVKELIHKAKKAVEQEDIETLALLTSEDYHGYYGNNKEEAITRARRDFSEVESLDIDIDKIELKIADNEAEAVIYFYVSGTFLGSTVYDKVPFRGIVSHGEAPDKVRAVWRKEPDGKWRILEIELHLK